MNETRSVKVADIQESLRTVQQILTGVQEVLGELPKRNINEVELPELNLYERFVRLQDLLTVVRKVVDGLPPEKRFKLPEKPPRGPDMCPVTMLPLVAGECYPNPPMK